LPSNNSLLRRIYQEPEVKGFLAGAEITEDESYWEQFKDKEFTTFWDMIGRPEKAGLFHPIYPYEDQLIEAMKTHKHLWVKKATGLGITELMLRYIAWMCTKDNQYSKAQVCIVTGPRIELAVTLINRIKAYFYPHTFKSKETVVELNGCRIEAYPSHHLDTMRGLPTVKFILLDEGDFFPPGEQQDARDVSERYIAKSDPFIVMVSTPNLPGGLFESIEKEQNCLYHRIFLPYTVGLGNIYTEKDINAAKQSPSFEREYNLKYGQGIGNIFPYQLVDAISLPYSLAPETGQKVLAVDPAYGSSKFAIVGMEKRQDGIAYVTLAEQHARPSPSAMLDRVSIYAQQYRMVLVDSAHPGLVTDLRDRGIGATPVLFNKELSAMTVASAQAVKEQKVRIHPAYSELAYQLKAVQYNEKGHPDKKELSFDLGDAFMMACNHLVHYKTMWADLGRG
jgi:hypothetical protein